MLVGFSFAIEAVSTLVTSRYATYPLNPDAVDTDHPACNFSAVTCVPSDDVQVSVAGSYVTVTIIPLAPFVWSLPNVVTVRVTSLTAFTDPLLRISAIFSTNVALSDVTFHMRSNSYTIKSVSPSGLTFVYTRLSIRVEVPSAFVLSSYASSSGNSYLPVPWLNVATWSRCLASFSVATSLCR